MSSSMPSYPGKVVESSSTKVDLTALGAVLSEKLFAGLTSKDKSVCGRATEVLQHIMNKSMPTSDIISLLEQSW